MKHGIHRPNSCCVKCYRLARQEEVVNVRRYYRPRMGRKLIGSFVQAELNRVAHNKWRSG